MLNDDEASRRFLAFSENTHVKDDIFVIKTSTCFKRSYCLLRRILVQLQIIVKAKMIFILY